MPVAICNNCSGLVPYKNKGGIKKAKCECGSKDLTAVSGRWSDQGGWNYYDRRGQFVKFVPQEISFETESKC